jgi:hypothetical protein
MQPIIYKFDDPSQPQKLQRRTRQFVIVIWMKYHDDGRNKCCKIKINDGIKIKQISVKV